MGRQEAERAGLHALPDDILHLIDLRLAGALDLALPQTLLSLAELLTRGFQLGEYQQRVPFGQVMKEVGGDVLYIEAALLPGGELPGARDVT